MSSVVNPNTNPVLLVSLMKGQRSKITDLLYLYNCQLVTLILSSVVNPNTNPDPNPKRTGRKNGCDDSGGSV